MSLFRHLSLPAVLIVGALLCLATPRASAQCAGPDGLNFGACCQPAQLVLPPFPQASVPGLGICWNACSVAGTQDLRIDWTPPAQVLCGEFVSQITVRDIGGAPLLTGTMVLDYTRTWEEIDTTGAVTQVWRFATKVDLSAVAGVPPSLCVTPSCIQPVGPYGTSFYYGYLDYENCDPTVSPWESSLVLFHNCDRFIHRPGISDKPGSFHPNGSFAIVAPHSPAQPFIPANQIASGGPLVSEATRNVPTTPGVACTVEDRIATGSMDLIAAGCICSLSSFPNQQTLRKLSGTTSCSNAAGIPGSFTSVKLPFPAFPWWHVVTTSIGRWSSPASYPGQESAWVDEGVFALQDACSGDFAEFKYGGSTRDGWAPVLPIPIAVNNFTDLADNYTAPLFGPYPTPMIGSVHPTNHLLYTNEP